MATRDDDAPAWDPYDPLQQELPSETTGARGGTGVQGLRYGRSTRGMGYGPQTNSEAFGAYGHPRAFEPSHEVPRGPEGGDAGGMRYASNRDVQSMSSDYAGLADASIPPPLSPVEDLVFEQRYRSSAGRPPARRSYPRRDERIRDDVAERLYHSAHLDPTEVSVDVQEATVRLEGTVTDRWMKHAIEDAAAAVPGVKDVENRVRVSGSARSGASPGALHGSAGRGSTAPDLDTPAARVDSPQHGEWLLDEADQESLPASDTPSSVQPGSIASRRQRP